MPATPSPPVAAAILYLTATASASSSLPWPGEIGFSPYPLDHINATLPHLTLPPLCDSSSAAVVPTAASTWSTLLVMAKPTDAMTGPPTVKATGGALAGTATTVSVMGRGSSAHHGGYIAMWVAFAATGWGLVVA